MHCKALILLSLCVIAYARPQADVSSSEEDFEGDNGGRGRFRHHLPAFMNSLSEEAKAELKTIFDDQSLTRQQFDEKLQAWATAQGTQAQEAYNRFKEMIEKKMTEMKKRIEESSLSDTIKAAALQIEQLHNDGSLTMNELKEKAKAIIDGLSEEDRNQILQFMHQRLRPKRQAEAPMAPQTLPIPPFLEHATEQAKQSFLPIPQDKSLTKAQLVEKFDAWAAQQDDQVKVEYEETKKKVEEMKAALRTKIESEGLSEEVKAALAKLEAIDSDMQLTPEEEAQQVVEVLKALPEEARKQMMNLITPVPFMVPQKMDA